MIHLILRIIMRSRREDKKDSLLFCQKKKTKKTKNILYYSRGKAEATDGPHHHRYVKKISSMRRQAKTHSLNTPPPFVTQPYASLSHTMFPLSLPLSLSLSQIGIESQPTLFSGSIT